MPTPSDRLEKWSGIHVSQGWLAEIHYPSGWRYLSDGMGSIDLGGKTWEGVNSTEGSQMVSLSNIRQAALGEAPYVDIIVAAADLAFMKAYWLAMDDYENIEVNIYDYIVEQETMEVLMDPDMWFRGHVGSISVQNMGNRYYGLTVKVVSRQEGLNFAATKYDWSPAGQRARFPGDLGLDLINSPMVEDWNP